MKQDKTITAEEFKESEKSATELQELYLRLKANRKISRNKIESLYWQIEYKKLKEEIDTAIIEIESRMKNIINNGDNMPQTMQEGGVMAFESSIDVIREIKAREHN